MTMNKLLGISLALIMLAGSTQLGFSESLKVQLDQGLDIEQIQCNNTSHLLVERTNGKMACVSERTADKLIQRGGNLISNIIETNVEESLQSESKIITLNLGSDIPFIDDNREYPIVVQRAPAPWNIYDKITNSYDDIMKVDSKGIASVQSVTHEKYSVNSKGLYIEDWMPTYIPNGYKLLYAETGVDEYEHNQKNIIEQWGFIQFVPNDFELTPEITNHDLRLSNGFSIGIKFSNVEIDEVQDSFEHRWDVLESQGNHYGEQQNWERDGRYVGASEGGNGMNYYTAGIAMNPDTKSVLHVNSNYLSIEELKPIFLSMMK